jgi:nitric oxide reductase subunit C
MTSLVASFALQSYLVYTDDTAVEVEPLSAAALEGQTLWRRHNCQSCHQIYGFGGFLGPDLTNAAGRMTREHLDEILTLGRAPMPAFEFTSAEIGAIEAYLQALDTTGVGQARRTPPVDREQLALAIDRQAERHPMGEEAKEGMEVFGGTCSTCHTLFQPTSLGPFVAPDLSNVAERTSDSEIDLVLAEGRPARGMPAASLSEHERRCIIRYFNWVATHRQALMPPGLEENRGLPWWEFR